MKIIPGKKLKDIWTQASAFQDKWFFSTNIYQFDRKQQTCLEHVKWGSFESCSYVTTELRIYMKPYLQIEISGWSRETNI
jgi:hypothetical protein